MFNITQDPKWFTFQYQGRRLDSISKFIRQFTPEFDSDGISKTYAIKHGLEQQAVLDMWKEKADKSKRRGVFIHKCVELFLKHGEILETPDEKLISKKALMDVYLKLGEFVSDYDTIGIEMIVGDPDNNIAGVFDYLGKHKQTNDYILIDWKTNEGIKTENKWQSFLEPISNIPHANFYEYSLQLSLLKHCIKKDLNIEINNMVLFHISDNIVTYPISFMEKEINSMFEYNKN